MIRDLDGNESERLPVTFRELSIVHTPLSTLPDPTGVPRRLVSQTSSLSEINSDHGFA